MAKPISVCSCGAPVTFYWRECVTADHVTAAVEYLMRLVAERPGCTTNAYIDADNEDAFERLLTRAAQGQLKPVDHVKAIVSVPSMDMFEIRWTDIKAIGRNPVSGLIEGDLTLHVRLYYLEEEQPWIVGLYAHEKEIVDGDDDETRSRQKAHIQNAETYALTNVHRRWGVDALSTP